MNPWDERFNQPEFVYGTEPNEFIREQAYRFTKGADIAAYAEGEGRNAVHLASLGLSVTAYDYAQSGLDKTSRLARQNNVHVETKLSDLVQDPLPVNTYDGAIMVFGHFPRNRQLHVLDKMMASLKPNGLFLFEIYEEKQLAYGTGGPKEESLLYRGSDVLTWAEQFEVLQFFIGEAVRQEGTLHTGKGFVIQGVVKKTSLT